MNPFLKDNFAPLRFEGAGFPLKVTGKLPLSGTLFRNGANPQFEPKGSYHWFGGDGMIHAVSFNGNKAWSKNAWVRTRRFEIERKYGFNALATFASPEEIDPTCLAQVTKELGSLPESQKMMAMMALVSDVANTHVMMLGKNLLALAEGGLPYMLDAKVLKTSSTLPIPGFATFTAHPKRNIGAGGALIGNGTLMNGQTAICALSPQLGAETLGHIETPAPAMLHDMAITETKVVLPWFPAVFGSGLQKPGSEPEPIISWKPELGAKIAIAPLKPGFKPENVQWFDAPLCHSYHVTNAYDESDCVVLDLICRPRLSFFAEDKTPNEPYLARWRANLKTGKLSEAVLYSGMPIEFPRIDERVTGRKHNYSVMACAKNKGNTFDGVLRFDHTNQKSFVREFSGELSEPVHGFDSSGAEAIIVVEYLPSEKLSVVHFLHCTSLETLASVHLETRIPHGFHGSFEADFHLEMPQ